MSIEKRPKSHKFWTSTCNLVHLTVLFDCKLPPSFSGVNNMATKALQKLVVAKTAEPVILLKHCGARVQIRPEFFLQ